MFPDSFTKVLDELARDSRNQDLDFAINTWCIRVNLSEEATRYIRNWIKSKRDSIEYSTNFGWKVLEFKDSDPEVRQPFTFFRKIKNMQNINIKDTFIIAFVLTGVGLLIYLLNQKQKQAVQDSSRQSPEAAVRTVQKTTNQILILALNASKKEVVNFVESKGKIEVNDTKALYESTEYLRLDFQFDISLIEQQFSVPTGKESEYDIYLIQVKLKEPDEGFKPNVNQLDRYDAFCKLADLADSVKVSSRLKMEAYESLKFYSR